MTTDSDDETTVRKRAALLAPETVIERKRKARASKSRPSQAAKDDFLTLIAHELRTPLTPMAMLLQVIENKARSGVVDLDAIGRAQRQVVRLTKLVGDLVDCVRLETQTIEGAMEQVDLAELASDVLHAFRAASPKHDFSLSLPLFPVHVVGDRARFEHVFVNLLDNAVKFSPQGGPVRVEARRTETHVTFAVCDLGIGVPKSQQHRVFERFFRASNVSSANFRGLGLGLHVTDAIVRKHGGSMGVTSRVGRGSRFTFTLPLATARSLDDEEARALRVLIVDDDPDIVEALAAILELEGFEVSTANDGSEALLQLESSRPDLLLLDLMMPTTNGWEVLRRLRDGEHRIPVIVLSAHPSLSERAGDHRVDAFLGKPFEVPALLRKMRELLGSSRPSPLLASLQPAG